MRKKYLTLAVVLLFALGGILAHAQVREGDIVFSLSPAYPNQNQNVTATLSSYATNLDKAYISWSVNGKETTRGIGKKVFLFTTENLGTTLNLSVTINTIDGQSISKNAVVTPTNVDMLWEAANSYAPPFYRGKTLVGSQGAFKVVAMPNFTNSGGGLNVNNLSYTWSKDGDIDPDASGWGKNYFTFTNSYLDRENAVVVQISDILGSANTSGSIALQTVTPEVLFYERDPALGVKWEESLGNGIVINESGSAVVAEPYFFSPQDITSPDLTFTWSINGEGVAVSGAPNELAVRPESGQSGSAIIKVVVNNIKTLFQQAQKQISVNF